ncbi:MAG: hypothetical protein AAFR76_08550 [Planctomycetota bacterium]
MKGVLGWLKSNIVIVILGLLIVVPLPVAWFFSSGMNQSLREGRQQDGQAALRNVQGVNVNYEVPAFTRDQQAISESAPPNAAMTAHYKAELERRLAQVDTVKQSAIEYNRRGRGVLVEGLFPEPTGESQLKRNEMGRRAVAADTPESAFAALFDELRIRPPVNNDELASLISVQRERKVGEMSGDQGDNALTPEQLEQVNAEMLDLRITRYRTHAMDTVFYGSVDVLPMSLPRTGPSAPPPLEVCFAWQADYWLIEDLLRALADANSRLDPSGVGGSAVGGVVKRLYSIEVDPLPFAGGGGPSGPSDRNDFGDQPGGGGGAANLTGRAPLSSSVYDVRNATLSLLVSSAKLPTLIDSLGSSNFITVLDLDLEEVDPWAELEQGFYVGDDAVVRATLSLEVLYLREWTTPFMPEGVKEALGISTGSFDDEG